MAAEVNNRIHQGRRGGEPARNCGCADQVQADRSQFRLLPGPPGRAGRATARLRRAGPAAGRDRRPAPDALCRPRSSASRRPAIRTWSTGLRASLIGAALAGQAWPGMDDGPLLDAVLDDGQTWAYADAAMRTPAWLSAAGTAPRRASRTRPGLRAGFGISRGDRGGVRMIDAARAMPLLRWQRKNGSGALPSREPAAHVRRAVARFGEWDNLIDGQLALLSRNSPAADAAPERNAARRYGGRGRRALKAAVEAGHGPEDREQFERADQGRGRSGLADGRPAGERPGQGSSRRKDSSSRPGSSRRSATAGLTSRSSPTSWPAATRG